MHVPFFIGVWLSLVERYVRDVEAAGSNPVTPIPENGGKPGIAEDPAMPGFLVWVRC